jgi:hypothetical protein
MKKILMIAMIIALPVAFSYAADEKADQKKIEEPKKAEKEKSKEEYIADLNPAGSEDKILAAEEWVGQKQEEGAVDSLLVLLKGDKRDKVRMNAAVALGLIAQKKSDEKISEIVINELSADVRYAEVLAIARIGISSKKSADNLSAARDKETDPFIIDFIKKMEEKFKSK